MIESHTGEQSQIFGEDPALYDRFRPSYPREMIEAIIADTSQRPVLEIGAGTGKATKALIALGKDVHALEPDQRMAALLKVSCPTGLVQVETATLETANLPLEAFDLVVAAQAWHWVDPTVGYDVAADSLVPHGRLALMWHHPRTEQGLLGEALNQLYAVLAPGITNVLPGAKASGFDPAAEPSAALGRFRSWSRLEHRWRRHLDGPGLVGWLCSSSDHRLLGVEQRTELMSAVAALVAELGGDVAVEMTTVAHMAHRI